jgi:hypothetical protein
LKDRIRRIANIGRAVVRRRAGLWVTLRPREPSIAAVGDFA